MSYLLDTHIALWALEDANRLPRRARELLENGADDFAVSDVSLWELAIKHALHPDKIRFPARTYAQRFGDAGFASLEIDRSSILAYETLNLAQAEGKHRDPFDRMLLAQAKAHGMLLLTHDRLLTLYDEPWVLLV
jgi:PIN domain nuclease of toxin-antitoxin system